MSLARVHNFSISLDGFGNGDRLLDHMRVVVVPILLGRGVRLWEGLEGLEQDYQVGAAGSPSG